MQGLLPALQESLAGPVCFPGSELAGHYACQGPITAQSHFGGHAQHSSLVIWLALHALEHQEYQGHNPGPLDIPLEVVSAPP